VFACVGGGGLLSGIAAYIKAVRPDVKVIGVEAVDAAGMTESLCAGKVVTLPSVGLFADGAAVRTVGAETFRVCNALVDEMITVKTDEICSAIKLCFNDTRSILEPAGALAIAGMVKYSQQHAGKASGQTFVAISSGANMDFDRLRFVSERADSSEALLSVTIPERAGAFRALYQLLHPRNVTEFSYRHNASSEANVIVSFQALSGKAIDVDKAAILAALRQNNYAVEDLSDNEMAKAHARHLAGGRAVHNLPTAVMELAGGNVSELVYRFEFPEAPGALDKFLHTLNHFNQGWSISLFHYRNHGHDYGRVLVGLLVRDAERPAFQTFLDKLAYAYYDETTNVAYQQFIK
jgi:threonine dehydratase